MKNERILYWFRRDLRLDDQPGLAHAIEHGSILPVYILEDRDFGTTSYGFPKTGRHRARFLRESLEDLSDSISSLGGELLVMKGQAESIFPELCRQYKIDTLYAMREVGWDERQTQHDLETTLKDLGTTLFWFWTHPMIHPKDLPFEIKELPDVFTKFRKEVEKKTAIRPPVSKPDHINWISIDQENLHRILNWEETPLNPVLDSVSDPRTVHSFHGGEKAGLERLQEYIWEGDHLRRYKETRNGLLGADYSSKFSPWLANGTLSSRRIYAEVKRYEEERVANESTYWLIFELLWRDFFQFSALKYGRRLFSAGGIQGKSVTQKVEWSAFKKWSSAQTGDDFIDANMTELNQTGFMSNRGRQNVASVLSQDFGVDWRMGAEYFESILLDYDVASNWGNWAYNSTVGHDPRNRKFDVERQAWMYDRNHRYRKHWGFSS